MLYEIPNQFMFCSSCGANVKEGSAFCTKCGAKINSYNNNLDSSRPSIESSGKLNVHQNKNQGSNNIGNLIIQVIVGFFLGYWAVRIFGIIGLIVVFGILMIPLMNEKK